MGVVLASAISVGKAMEVVFEEVRGRQSRQAVLENPVELPGDVVLPKGTVVTFLRHDDRSLTPRRFIAELPTNDEGLKVTYTCCHEGLTMRASRVGAPRTGPGLHKPLGYRNPHFIDTAY